MIILHLRIYIFGYNVEYSIIFKYFAFWKKFLHFLTKCNGIDDVILFGNIYKYMQ